MKILIVDDHILFREGLISLLKSHRKYEIVGEAGTVKQAVEQARLLKPDLILMDFHLPDGTGLEATQLIISSLPQCKIVFITVSEEDDNLFRALRSGASGYILKNVPIDQLLKSLDRLERGEIAMSSDMTTRVIKEFARSQPQNSLKPSETTKLSRREIEILCELARGSSNQEIARSLFISENTVKHHIHSILTKLELKDRHEAARYARDHLLSK